MHTGSRNCNEFRCTRDTEFCGMKPCNNNLSFSLISVTDLYVMRPLWWPLIPLTSQSQQLIAGLDRVAMLNVHLFDNRVTWCGDGLDLVGPDSGLGGYDQRNWNQSQHRRHQGNGRISEEGGTAISICQGCIHETLLSQISVVFVYSCSGTVYNPMYCLSVEASQVWEERGKEGAGTGAGPAGGCETSSQES